MEPLVYDGALTPADHVVLKNLERDIENRSKADGNHTPSASSPSDLSEGDETDITVDSASLSGNSADIASISSRSSAENLLGVKNDNDQTGTVRLRRNPARAASQSHSSHEAHDDDVSRLKAVNDPAHPDFQSTVVLTVDDCSLYLPAAVTRFLLRPYVSLAKKLMRHDTDVVMLTHLILYFTTLVPSAVLLYRHFSYTHGVLHWIMQFYYVGTYTLMMHQHIHQRGILNKKLGLFDKVFPFILDPMMGHTWNTYYYHHVKHHHVEGNGPDDLSSTIRYQRDSLRDFLHYLGRFFFLVWIDLPLYFLRKNRPGLALRTAVSEVGNYLFYIVMAKVFGLKPTIFVFLLPLMFLRIGLMIGNWGQHALVDPDEPDSDYRSSITLVDVPSNRFCFNDGYHTSHHLNPLRHWRDHPVSFLEQKQIYAREGALIFHNIDFLMITVRLFRKDYEHLAKCLVPIGSQIDLTMEERVLLLKRLTRKFTEEEIKQKFRQHA